SSMKDQEKYKQHSDLVWTIANLLRGPYRPPQYRRVMIPLTVLRRLDCVLEDRKDEVAALYKQLKEADDARPEGKRMGDESIEKIVFNKTGLSFFNKSGLSFQTILADPDHIARNLNYYIASFSTRARTILEKFKFEEEIDKLDESNRLFEVVKEFSNVDFHPSRISNTAMGYIFEDLVRRFNEQANEEAGDHFTPREVVKLMVKLLFTGEEHIYKAGKVIKIYDPTCGTGGILSESEKAILEENGQANVELFGQEYNPESYAICGSDLMIKGEDVRNIVFGDTLGTGRPKEGQTDGDGHPGERFHYMAANPPFGVEWKPEKDHVTREHETFGFDGRFGPGLPRINDGALLFLLHMISKMQRPPASYQLPAPGGIEGGEGSRIAIIFNGSPLFTGDAGGGESNIRRWIIENDMLEAVVGLPDQLFYNTGIYTYIWIVTNRKAPERQGKVQLINATEFAWKMKKSLGNKRKKIGEGEDGEALGSRPSPLATIPGGEPDHIAAITTIYAGFGHDERKTLKDIQSNIDPGRDQSKAVIVSKVFHNQDFGYFKITVERPLRLNFAVTDERIGNVRQSTYFETLAISQKRKNKGEIAEEILAGRQAQQEILRILDGMKPAFADGEPVKDRALFEKQLAKAFKDSDVKLDASLKKALLAPGALGEKDPTAQPCLDAKGNPEPDPDLRDSENVPFPGALLANGRRDTVNPLIDLPLPLDYETAKTKGKVDKSALLELVQDHCEAYLAEEVLPYRPDAWIDHGKIKVGYEIPFNRHFYQYEPPRELSEIEAEIKGLEVEILGMLRETV
ncbi:MAG: type I restriction-modification system subunit M, partial [Methylomicrobium sp.]